MNVLTKKQASEAVSYIQSISDFQAEFGIILGTGLGALVEDIDIVNSIKYDDIPHFPISTVESHHGRLIFGKLEGINVIVMQGRFHYYEGYSMLEITFPVRILAMLGISKLLISNAAGGLNDEFDVSQLMVVSDHIDLFPDNPLRGKNSDHWGPRFPDMSEVYNREWQNLLLSIGKKLGIIVNKGVYAGVSGPNLETKAEYKYLAVIGADAVGMSTIPEAIVAHHMGMKIGAISVITDMCTPDRIEKVTVEKVIAAAHKAEPGLTRIIRQFLKEVG